MTRGRQCCVVKIPGSNAAERAARRRSASSPTAPPTVDLSTFLSYRCLGTTAYCGAVPKRHLAMSAGPECTVTFPIENGMFGVDSLAKRLNVLMSDVQIGDWHPGRWIDWGHNSHPNSFQFCRGCHSRQAPLVSRARRGCHPGDRSNLNAGERRAPERWPAPASADQPFGTTVGHAASMAARDLPVLGGRHHRVLAN